MKELLSVDILDKLRKSLYGRNSRLAFYSLSPINGEQLSFVILNGWYVTREKRDRMDGRNVRVSIWLSRNAKPEMESNDWILKMNTCNKIDIQVDERRIQSYRIVEVRTLTQVHAGWIFTTEPIESSIKQRY
jgi:hypothetical protein